MRDPIIDAIHEEFPNATIVDEGIEGGVTPHIDGVTPGVDSMFRKYSTFRYRMQRSSFEADAGGPPPTSASDLVARKIDINDASLPPSLRRRTVIIDKKLGKIIASEG